MKAGAEMSHLVRTRKSSSVQRSGSGVKRSANALEDCDDLARQAEDVRPHCLLARTRTHIFAAGGAPSEAGRTACSPSSQQPTSKRRRFSSASADPAMHQAFSQDELDDEESSGLLFSSAPTSRRNSALKPQRSCHLPPPLPPKRDPAPGPPPARAASPAQAREEPAGHDVGSAAPRPDCPLGTVGLTAGRRLRGRALLPKAALENSRRGAAGADSSLDTVQMTFPSPRKPPKKKNKSLSQSGGWDDKENESVTPPFFSPAAAQPEQPAARLNSFAPASEPRAEPTAAGSCLGDAPATGKSEDCRSAYCRQCLDALARAQTPAVDDPLGAMMSRTRRIQFPLLSLARTAEGDSQSRKQSNAGRGDCAAVFKAGRITPVVRARMINFMVHCQAKLPHPPSSQTLHVGISCFDRFCVLAFKRGDKDSKDKVVRNIPAVATAALHLASKIEDVWAVEIEDLVVAAAGAFSAKEVLIWEKRLLHALDFKISVPTVLDFVLQFLREGAQLTSHFDSKCKHHASRNAFAECCCQLCNLCGDATQPDIHHTASKCHYQNALLSIDQNVWDPKHSEGKHRSCVEATAIFLAEFYLTHPTSMDFPYDLIASAAVYITLHIIGCDQVEPATFNKIMPPQCMRVLLESNVAQEPVAAKSMPKSIGGGSCAGFLNMKGGTSVAQQLLASILCAYDEFLGAEEQLENETERELLERAKKYVKEQTAEGGCSGVRGSPPKGLYQEAFEETDEGLRNTKLSAFLIQAAYKEGFALSATSAKSTVKNLLSKRIIGPHGLLVEPQQPKLPSKKERQFPLGVFAADVVLKHKDAAAHLKQRYRRWVESQAQIEECFRGMEPENGAERSGVASEAEEFGQENTPARKKRPERGQEGLVESESLRKLRVQQRGTRRRTLSACAAVNEESDDRTPTSNDQRQAAKQHALSMIVRGRPALKSRTDFYCSKQMNQFCLSACSGASTAAPSAESPQPPECFWDALTS